ncbi:uncharacterized protein ZK1073.1-like isoform X3 [Haliotis rufescens]|uniref:uncharacterized protein ZK1073.1-like isoform X3 n=1 Tax=Haliotis rufescens TaxID=6454 RepID=UPI00201F55F1|nr:uncharacterized protein ZK1073.1-like isoform X3 [Haliotis rufescens]
MGLEAREISAPRVGRFKIYIQGDLKHNQTAVLTVHDLGCNHSMWTNFLTHPSMEEITKRAAFIHVDVPGQEDEAPDLPAESPPKKGSGISVCYTFPSMQSLGEDLVCVLDQLDVKQVIGLGEGAGANIIARFAMAQPKRVLGVCLIHCTGSTANFMEAVKDKVRTWKLDQIGMNPSAEAYLVFHRFGSEYNIKFEKAENKEQLEKVIESFQQSLRSKINAKNLKRFVQAFMKRSNIADNIGKIKCSILMVTGSKASANQPVRLLFEKMNDQISKKNTEMMEVDGVANVLEERPARFAESFLYFLQGLGVAGGVPMMRGQRSSSFEGGTPPCRTRSMSMEEADQPRGIYSMSPPKFGVSPPKMSSSPPTGSVLSSSPTKS